MQLNSDTILTIILIVAAFLLAKFLPRIMAGVPFVDAQEVKRLLAENSNTVVLDVRTKGEFQSGHVPGAVNIPLSELMSRIKSLGPDVDAFKSEPVYVMCRTESRASSAVRMLKKAGFTQLSIIKGGAAGWKRKDLGMES